MPGACQIDGSGHVEIRRRQNKSPADPNLGDAAMPAGIAVPRSAPCMDGVFPSTARPDRHIIKTASIRTPNWRVSCQE
jgi:hypothetical protein